MTIDTGTPTLEDPLGLVAPAKPQVRVLVKSKPHGRFPRWLRAVDATHRAERPRIAVIDALLIGGAAALAGTPLGSLIAMTAGLIAVLYASNWYRFRSTIETQGFLWSVSALAMPTALTTLIAFAAAPWLDWARDDVVRFGIVAAGSMVGFRIVTWVTLVETRRHGLGLRRTLIVGDSKHGRLMSQKLMSFPEVGLLPVAVLPTGNGHGYTRFVPSFPAARDLSRAIVDADIEHVVLAPDGSDEAILECVKGSESNVAYSMLPPLSEFFLHPGVVAQAGGLPLIPLGRIAQHHRTLPGKRFFDIIVATTILILISPLLAATAAAIKLVDRGPVLYRQRRVGRDGRSFHMLKFRSMVVGAERFVIDLRDQNVSNGLLFKVYDDPRITRIGRIIRRLSIDELPQLWNVIRGEMSLVGPRPLAVEPEDFGAIDNQRHAVRPGISGYWQVSGSNELTYEEMIKLDFAYIENWSLWLDVRLLVRTIPALLHRRGPL
ncbi:MAG: sugar transferase [Actinomycetota bacterium]